MEKTLTTETPESDVNGNSITDVNNNQLPDDAANSSSTEDKSYDDAWDNIDLADEEAFANLGKNDTPEPEAIPADEESVEAIETKANEAFMNSNPTLKFKGKDIPIDDPQELIDLAQKGFKLETEMANIKPQKQILNAVEGVPLEVLQAVADLHSGKQEAIDYLKSQYGIQESVDESDFFGNTEDKPTSTYKPEVKTENPIEEFWTDYTKNDQQGAAKVSDIYGQLDSSFQNEIYKPQVFEAFVQSVSTGEFDEVYPLAVKEKTLNPAVSWIQAYTAAAQKSGSVQSQKTEPPASATPPPSGNESREFSDSSKADMVWEDDDYFKKMDADIYKS